jgi:nucleoside-diphosphate-sugar epimerase
VSKLAGEALVGAYAHAHGLGTVSLRYFSVYGPRQRPDMAAHRFIEALLDGAPLQVFGDGTQARDFTYVGDVVRATVSALFTELPPGAVIDVAGGRPVTVRELISLLHDLMGQDDVAVLHARERRGDVPRTEGRSDLAREHLGWTAEVDLPTGLAQQIAWHTARRAAPVVDGVALDSPLGAS